MPVAASRRGGGWAWPALIVAVLLAAAVAIAVRFAGDGTPAPADTTARGDGAAARTPVGIERGLVLHAIDSGPPATARLSLPGSAVRAYRVGGTIAPGVVVRAIGIDRVEVDADGRRIVLTLDRAGGRPGTRAGLDPEPVAPSGELSGAEIERRIRAQREPVRRLPEEEAAGAPR